MNRVLCVLAALLLAGRVDAGQDCRSEILAPEVQSAAAEQALEVAAALDAEDAPVALVARVGTDLSAHGLHYSHVGFAWRDAPEGRWSVVHLLNDCGTDRSALFVEGLVDYYADARIALDTAVVWLQPDLASRVAQALADRSAAALHDPDYNVIAHPLSASDQNSTAWVLEVLAAARRDLPPERALAQRAAAADGHRPSVLHIAYTKRIAGGLFARNARFTDHPLGARLRGEYEVVTVTSILDWLQRSRAATRVVEDRRPRSGR